MVKHHEVGLWRWGHSDVLFSAIVDIDLNKRTLSTHSVMLSGKLWAACLEPIAAAAAAATRTGCVEKLHSLFSPCSCCRRTPTHAPQKDSSSCRWRRLLLVFYHSVQHIFWASLSRSCHWPVWIYPAEGHFQKCLPLSFRFASQMVHKYIHTCCHSWVKFLYPSHLHTLSFEGFFLNLHAQHLKQALTRQRFPGTAVTFTSFKLCIL